MPQTQSFQRDAGTGTLFRNIGLMYYRALAFTLVIPIILYELGPSIGRHYSVERLVNYAVIATGTMLLLAGFFTWMRLSWGKSLAFGRDLQIVKNNGSTQRVPRPSIQTIKVQPKSAVIVSWTEDSKARHLIIGKEGFTDDTWRELVAFAQRWEGEAV